MSLLTGSCFCEGRDLSLLLMVIPLGPSADASGITDTIDNCCLNSTKSTQQHFKISWNNPQLINEETEAQTG